MGKMRTVTVSHDSGQLTITGYYAPAFHGTMQVPPEPALFEVTEAAYVSAKGFTVLGSLPSDLLAEGIWYRLGDLALRAVEERDAAEREAHAEREE
jgi:hypothetical protein